MLQYYMQQETGVLGGVKVPFGILTLALVQGGGQPRGQTTVFFYYTTAAYLFTRNA